MTKASSLYGSFISADDIKEPTPVTISECHVSEFTKEGQGTSRKVVLEFDDFPGRLAVNKTNGLVLIEKFGDETDLWIGQQITLTVETVLFKGKKVPGVRIQA
jgi:hypothetical protein